MSHAIDYPAPVRRRLWPTHRRAMPIAVVLVLLGVVGLCFIPMHTWHLRTNTLTGSSITKRTWFFGLGHSTSMQPSAMEARLLAEGVPDTGTWKFMSEHDLGFLGNPLGIGCASAPPSYTLRILSPELVRGLTQEQVIACATVLQTGTQEEQQKAVRLLVDQAFEAFDTKQ